MNATNAIAQGIFRLLHEEPRVVVPGLGTFVGEDQEAVFDHIQQSASPPKRQVTFDPSASNDDGRLVEYLSIHNNWSSLQTQERIQEFNKGIHDEIESGEMFLIPKVGRIYRDYEKKLKLIPELTNFNRDAFGLPDLNFQPIKRQTAAAPEAAPIPASTATAPPKSSFQETFSKWLLPIVAGCALLLIVLTIWLMNSRVKAPMNLDTPTKPSVESPTTVLPKEDVASTSESEQEVVTEESAPEATNETPTPTPDEEYVSEERERTAPRTTLSTAVVIIGAFGELGNAEKMIRKISKAGFEPYSDLSNGMNRVGIQVPYETTDNLKDQLEEIQDLYTKSAWVLNGKEIFGE